MNVPGSQDSDLAWLAYRYVSGELPASELNRFEERLSTDQSARETVANVVDLCTAIKALPGAAFEAQPERTIVPAFSAARVWPALGWMAVGAAACLALILGLQSSRRGSEPLQARQSAVDAAGDQRLALSWTTQDWTGGGPATDADEPPAADESPAADSAENIADTESGDAEANETTESGSWEPPSWVTAAIDESARPGLPANSNPQESQ